MSEKRVQEISIEQSTSEEAEKLLHFWGLSWEKLNGKSVVDVGAGLGEFVKEAQRRGINAVAIDLMAPRENYGYGTPKRPYGDNEVYEEFPSDFVVADVGVELPFPDGTFDFVVSNASVPAAIRGSEEVKTKSVRELLRVLKEGGEVRLGSVPDIDLVSGEILSNPQKATKLLLDNFKEGELVSLGNKINYFSIKK